MLKLCIHKGFILRYHTHLWKPAILFLGRVLRFEALITLVKGCDSMLGKTFSFAEKRIWLRGKSGLLEMRQISSAKIVCVLEVYTFGASMLRNFQETWIACKSQAKDLLPRPLPLPNISIK